MPTHLSELLLRCRDAFVTWIGVFIGSLLWDVIFGDGIQTDDYFESFSVATVAVCVHLTLAHLKRRHG